MRTRFAALAMIGCLVADPSIAHQDRILKRSADGSLRELPAEYQPAAIEIGPAETRGQGRRIPRVVVRLSGVENVLEPCVAELFLRPKSPAMRIHASWYHDFTLLPPYLVVDLPSQMLLDANMFSGYSVMFDLRTAKIIELEMAVARPGSPAEPGSPAVGDSMRTIPAYDAVCGRQS